MKNRDTGLTQPKVSSLIDRWSSPMRKSWHHPDFRTTISYQNKLLMVATVRYHDLFLLLKVLESV